ncbi:L-serine ammonia-lyase [Zhengella mangrovi]|uniref:L-serine dehydratase n=1 Tax=Zhengella mangrovi TaxID=1982044 RepID=A0A2G1QHU5_9HYPH|nr:L-serine ammonia-lyase [Zhengella mangrovi]PHP65092.1 L-serine ammonia-lyase [Zhengella mangrovi]
MFLSVFDLFKISLGPSSSHTMGPMNAAARFLADVRDGAWPRPAGVTVEQLSASLHGSLAFTAKGHATDRAVLLGLDGHIPAEIDPDEADRAVARIEAERMVRPAGHPAYRFDPAHDLVIDRQTALPGHANGMVFNAHDGDGRVLLRRVYYSIGGGFVVTEDELNTVHSGPGPEGGPGTPFPFSSSAEMLAMARESGLSISAMKRANEEARMDRGSLDAGLDRVWKAMDSCIERGLSATGTLPGGLNVRRRAAAMHARLSDESRSNRYSPTASNDWLSVYAMAVNEENAAGGKVVTAPTNGAAGVVPAVLKYAMRFHETMDAAARREFLLTAAAIGGLIKHNASISGAEVGCQGEVGSASAMAAAGLAAVMGGTPEQVENAAEIALEHHLGMTCDPVAGLVQVPCIERNALGAVKAMTAASLALHGDGQHFVSLDACIRTMAETGRDMDSRYKETALGGLAVNVPEC